ncbi:hypothetical protein JCM11641_003775 [Rhodosporidiobolus odoratus]
MAQAPLPLIRTAHAKDLQSSHRHVVSLRNFNSPQQHSSILIYRSPTPPGADNGQPSVAQRWYGIANECEHLGLPLEQGDIEDLFGDVPIQDDDTDGADGPTIICPFHQYDFNLSSGHSSTGMKACTFRIEVREDGQVWMEPPGTLEDDWKVLGVRAVSERFAEPSTSSSPPDSLTSPFSSLTLSSSPSERPQSIVSYCRHILLAPTPEIKVALVRELVTLFRSGTLTRLADPKSDPPHPLEPYRSPTLKHVMPGKAASLGKGGTVQSRIKLLHSLATIELWAIDLCVDHIARFWDWRMGDQEGREGRKMGWGFVSDFLKVAEDEAKHFTLLTRRLSELDCTYGSLPVHSGLWESALQTSHSLFSRLAIIALVHEARGLDTNPRTIANFRKAGDQESAEVLEVIHYDEITHVAAGHRHFTRLCAALDPPVDPVQTFRQEVQQHFYGHLRGPFNSPDRENAGMTKEWYEDLGGRGVQNKTAPLPCAAETEAEGQKVKREVRSMEVEMEKV